MSTRERQTAPVEENQRSIDILRSLEHCDFFRQDRKDKTQVCLYRKGREGVLSESGEHFSVKDFLAAVDYYYENRDAEFLVNDAMQKPDGFVNVFAGPEDNRYIAAKIKNYLVPQILEFAYLLIRKEQKESSQNKATS